MSRSMQSQSKSLIANSSATITELMVIQVPNLLFYSLLAIFIFPPLTNSSNPSLNEVEDYILFYRISYISPSLRNISHNHVYIFSLIL